MHFVWPGDYHCLSLTRIQFHSPKVTPLTNLHEVTAQGLCFCNSNAWGWHKQLSKWNHRHDSTFPFSKMEKSSEVYRRNNNWPKTLACGTPDTTFTHTTVNHNVLRSIWWKLCQYRQHRTSNTHRTELIQNSLMVDPIKCCAEINLHDPSLLPTL